MKLNYNVTGEARKKLVGAISRELNSATRYLGAPTFGYEVDGYHIDKTGMLTGTDNLDLEDALHQHGFDAAEREYDEPDTYETGLGGMGALESLEELGTVLATKGSQDERNLEPDRMTIQMPLVGFAPEKLDNLCKLVNAKASLLKAALGAQELPIRHAADTLDFPWFDFTDDGETVNAYTALISLLCKTAIQKKRIVAKVKDVEGSPKYAMRCFLLTLGMIGDEYKTARKILLSRLEGNSSWKNGSPTNDYHEIIRTQLGEGYTFIKAYNASENGELRIVANDADDREHRFILKDGLLTEKP